MRLPRARPLGRDRADDRLPARLRARQRAARAGARRGAARQGLGAWDRRDQRGFLRNLVVREGRRTGELQVRLVTSPGKLDVDALIDAVDCRRPVLDPDRRTSARAPRAARPTLLAGAPQLREQLGDLELPDLARGVLPDQHRDGRAALRHRGRVRRRCAATSASSTSTAASARSGSRWPPRAREVVGVEIVEPAVADAIENARAQRDHQRVASTPATSASRCASSSSGPASPTSRSSTRRAPASRRRSCAGSSRPRRSGSSTSPATRRRSRRTRRSSSRPATSSSACARSTCSRRRRTSSASRCWRPVRTASQPRPRLSRVVAPIRTRVSRFGFVNAYLVEEDDGLTLDRHHARRAAPGRSCKAAARPADRADRAHARPRRPRRLARRAGRGAAGRGGR